MASSPCNCCNHVTKLPALSPSSTVPQTSSKSNEEVWKDIKLASLCNCSMDMFTTPSFFLNTREPFNNDSSSACNLQQAQPAFLPLGSSSIFQKQGHRPFLSLDNNTSFDDSESSKISPEKRVQRGIYSLADQRHKRMMKNRESADRSRARKQAYKEALEVKLVCLTEENSRLKRQVEELQFCLSSSAKPPKMGTLYRTTSSPF